MKLTICSFDVSNFKIILPKESDPAEITAAKFLKRIFKAACGVEVYISNFGEIHSIYIGGNPVPDDVKYDGFCIYTDNADLYLQGKNPRGTLYAAYYFAEHFLGYRHFSIDTEVIPTTDDVIIDKNYYRVNNPAFERRLTDWIGVTKYPENASFCRINGCEVSEKYGGYIDVLGGAHTFERLCPPQKYFEEHPEYFSLINGKRIPAGNVFDVPVGQLCLTNENVLRIVTENVLKELREHPYTKIIDVSQNDNGNYCQCENCAKIDREEGSPSGLLLRFVNKVAEAVEKEFPDVLVETFAYSYTRKPPKITKPRKNVIVRYCTIEGCFRHPLNDESCKINGTHFKNELEKWGEICNKISIWDYVTNYSCYLAPYPNFDVLRENLKFFAKCNAIHVFEEATPGCWSGEFGDLKTYILGKLMWNPYMSEHSYRFHINDFLKAYYGPGWENIKKYMELESALTENCHMGCFQDIDKVHYLGPNSEGGGEKALGDYEPEAYQKTYPDSYLENYIAHIDEIKKLWDDCADKAITDIQRMHIERSRLSVDYVDLFCMEHNKNNMNEEEQANYENAVKEFKEKKVMYGIHTNIWTQRYCND